MKIKNEKVNKVIAGLLGVVAAALAVTPIYIYSLNNTTPEYGPAEVAMAKRFGNDWSQLAVSNRMVRFEWRKEMLDYPYDYVRESVLEQIRIEK